MSSIIEMRGLYVLVTFMSILCVCVCVCVFVRRKDGDHQSYLIFLWVRRWLKRSTGKISILPTLIYTLWFREHSGCYRSHIYKCWYTFQQGLN